MRIQYEKVYAGDGSQICAATIYADGRAAAVLENTGPRGRLSNRDFVKLLEVITGQATPATARFTDRDA